MENFVIAIIILTVILVFTGINSFIICGICDEMTELIDSGNTEEAKTVWENKKGYIALFVRDAEIDVVSAEFNNASDKIANEDGEAELSITGLKDAINELKHGEKTTFLNVFMVDIQL